MIAPSNRLMIWTGVFFTLSAPFFADQPWHMPLFRAAAGVFLFLSLTDAAAARRRLNGTSIELPDIIRLSKGRDEQIQVTIVNRDNLLKEIHTGFPFPDEMISADPEMIVVLSQDHETTVVPWNLRPLKRGRVLLDCCYLRASSPLGLWTYRKKIPLRTEIKIYPDLFREKKEIAFLFQNRAMGTHSRRLIGKGRDFEQLREYIPGDSFEDIHWKATARRRYPVTKMYQIERTQEVYFIIDASRMSKRVLNTDSRERDSGSQEDTTLLERYISAALIMGLVTERIGDQFGFVAFSDRIHGFMRAARGKNHFNSCRDALYSLQPVKASPDFSELMTFISLKIRHRSLLVFLTNLEDPVLADNFIEHIGVLSKKHLVLVNMLNPGSINRIFSSPDARSCRDIYENLGRHMIYQHINAIRKRLNRNGIDFLIMENEKMIARLTSQYLNIKQKQQL
jgi:uncharacterized protein (DUF58 family)